MTAPARLAVLGCCHGCSQPIVDPLYAVLGETPESQEWLCLGCVNSRRQQTRQQRKAVAVGTMLELELSCARDAALPDADRAASAAVAAGMKVASELMGLPLAYISPRS